MRHVARLPPPPIFDDRRLVQLIAFRKLQIIDERFGVCVFCLRLNLACFCRYLHVLDVCCQFASCRATLGICKYSCKHLSEIHQQLCKNQSRFMQYPSKIKQNNTQERSESGLGSKSVPGYEKGATVFEKWVPSERHLGDFRRHFVPSWAPRGFQNQAFWHQAALKSQKMTS